MGKRVLIAESGQEIAESIEFLLRREGYEVLIVATVEQVLDEVTGFAPDMLLLDTELADGCGVDVCAEVRRRRGAAPVHIVLVTAGAHAESVEFWRKAGGDDVVIKPLVTLDLLARLRAPLGLAGAPA